MALRRNVERRIHQTVPRKIIGTARSGNAFSQEDQTTLSALSQRFLGDAWIPKLIPCNTWTEWLSLTKEFEHSWHVLLNLKPPESSSVCDLPAERSKRPRDDSDPWNVAWPSDTHRRLEGFRWTTRLLSTG